MGHPYKTGKTLSRIATFKKKRYTSRAVCSLLLLGLLWDLLENEEIVTPPVRFGDLCFLTDLGRSSVVLCSITSLCANVTVSTKVLHTLGCLSATTLRHDSHGDRAGDSLGALILLTSGPGGSLARFPFLAALRGPSGKRTSNHRFGSLPALAAPWADFPLLAALRGPSGKPTSKHPFGSLQALVAPGPDFPFLAALRGPSGKTYLKASIRLTSGSGGSLGRFPLAGGPPRTLRKTYLKALIRLTSGAGGSLGRFPLHGGFRGPFRKPTSKQRLGSLAALATPWADFCFPGGLALWEPGGYRPQGIALGDFSGGSVATFQLVMKAAHAIPQTRRVALTKDGYGERLNVCCVVGALRSESSLRHWAGSLGMGSTTSPSNCKKKLPQRLLGKHHTAKPLHRSS